MTSIAEGHEPQPEERRAAIAILDTLIQENVQVPIPAIKAVAESFPAQAAILISHLPIDASRATLNDWTMSENENSNDQILARIATMMLAKDPVSMRAQQSSLASRVVTLSEEELYVVVESNPVQQKGGFIEGICGTDLFDSESTPGWPQIFSYDLVENDPVSTTGILLDLNGDSIEFRRFEHLRHGTCGTPEVERLNPWTRHRLLTYWLGVQEDHMLWQPVESFSVIWTNNPSYQQQLGELVETQREKLQATVESLHELGILTESQTTTTPRLVVTIRCNIKPCPLI